MSRIESYPPGSFVWAELATSDPDGAKKFYGEMFGWTAADIPMPEGAYTIYKADENDVGAMYKAPEGVPNHWGAYFSVTDVDAAAARVTALGGKLIAGPFDVSDMGRMANVRDPQGAGFSLWQPKSYAGATHGGPLHNFCWAELMTPDPAGAAVFYSALFGWKTKPESGYDQTDYIEWVNGDRHAGGLFPLRGDTWKGVPPHWMLYVSVADCDERSEKAKQLGAAVRVQPTDIPKVGRFSLISDPQGAYVYLIHLTARPAAAA